MLALPQAAARLAGERGTKAARALQRSLEQLEDAAAARCTQAQRQLKQLVVLLSQVQVALMAQPALQQLQRRPTEGEGAAGRDLRERGAAASPAGQHSAVQLLAEAFAAAAALGKLMAPPSAAECGGNEPESRGGERPSWGLAAAGAHGSESAGAVAECADAEWQRDAAGSTQCCSCGSGPGLGGALQLRAEAVVLRSQLEDARHEVREMGRRVCDLQARLDAAARGSGSGSGSGGGGGAMGATGMAAAGRVGAAGDEWGADAAAAMAAEAAEAAARQAEALAAAARAQVEAQEARKEVGCPLGWRWLHLALPVRPLWRHLKTARTFGHSAYPPHSRARWGSEPLGHSRCHGPHPQVEGLRHAHAAARSVAEALQQRNAALQRALREK